MLSYIDLLLAFRQTLYESQWFQDGDSPKGSDDLPPFRHRTTLSSESFAYHTSDYVRDWRKFGYDYDILALAGSETSIHDHNYLLRIRRHLNEYGITGKLLLDDPKRIVARPGNDKIVHVDYIINVIYDR